jgi:hypothetical protein
MRQFQAFHRVCYLNRHAFHENTAFLAAYRMLKRCFPWPDYAITTLLQSNPTQLWRWKSGISRPRPSIIAFIAVLVMFRIGAATSGRELLNASKLLSSGELERMVDKFCAEEAQAIAKQKAAKEARKRARSVTKQDIPPVEPTK